MTYYLSLLKPYIIAFCATILCIGFLFKANAQAPKVSGGQSVREFWSEGVNYEIFVQSYYDSDGDGVGDIKGMTSKLDYLKNLGVKGVWLMPINPSPTYHKYDVTDYYGIHPKYGTMADFKNFLAEAHKRGIKVIIDLVINHTGTDHPWFQVALKDKNNSFHDFFVWSNQPAEIKKDSTHWYAISGRSEKYFGLFWSGMPDLNYDNPEVRKEIIKTGKYWLKEIGVDGFRLDAARHIYPDEEAKKTHAWWIEFRKAMEVVNPKVFMVGEVWAEDSLVAPYFKGLHANFNFDLGFKLTKALLNERDTSIVSWLIKTRKLYRSYSPDFIDATFLTNHDQNRILSELKRDEMKAKLAASILFTIPGAPFIYYGEEIGMIGKKPDEFLREPFLWNNENTDPGQTKWLRALYSKPDSVHALNQQIKDPNSIFSHYKKMIALRQSNPVFYSGEIVQSRLKNSQVLTYSLVHNGKKVLVAHNLSKDIQEVALEKNVKPWKIYFSCDNTSACTGNNLKIAPYSSVVLE